MTVWFATFPAAPRRIFAVSLALISIVIPLGLIWLSAGGLAHNWTHRAALADEVGALAERLSQRAEARPVGAGISNSVGAADEALERRADRLSAAIEAVGAVTLRREAVRSVNASGIVERRLTLVAAGQPEALAAALSDSARSSDLAVSAMVLEASAPGQTRVELTLVELVADGAGS